MKYAWIGVATVGAVISLAELLRWHLMGFRSEIPAGYILFLSISLGAFPIFGNWVYRIGFWGSFATAFVLAWAKAEPQISIGSVWLVGLMTLCSGLGLIIFYYAVTQEGKYKVGIVPMLLMTSFGIAIAFISSSVGGSSWMVSLIEGTFQASPDQAEQAVHLIRKTLHFSAYGTSALAAALVARDLGASVARSWLAGLSWGIPIAVFDEFWQTTSSVRTGTPWDVVLDSSGMIVALTILSLWIWRSDRSRRVPA